MMIRVQVQVLGRLHLAVGVHISGFCYGFDFRVLRLGV